MELAIRFLGLDLLSISVCTDVAEVETDGGYVTATPIGFSPSPGDQRWETGPGDGEL